MAKRRGGEGGSRRKYTWAPRRVLSMRDLIVPIRYFGGHCAYAYTANVFLCPCRSFDTRYLIRDREARRSKTD